MLHICNRFEQYQHSQARKRLADINSCNQICLLVPLIHLHLIFTSKFIQLCPKRFDKLFQPHDQLKVVYIHLCKNVLTAVGTFSEMHNS